MQLSRAVPRATSLLAAITLATLAVLTGCETTAPPCHVPPGTYALEFRAVRGTCDDALVEQFTTAQQSLTIEPQTVCRRFVSNIEGETEGGCALTTDMSAETTATGIHSGQAIIKLRCPDDGMECRHVFEVLYTRAAP